MTRLPFFLPPMPIALLGSGFLSTRRDPPSLSSPSYRFCEEYNAEMLRIAAAIHHLYRSFLTMDQVEPDGEPGSSFRRRSHIRLRERLRTLVIFKSKSAEN